MEIEVKTATSQAEVMITVGDIESTLKCLDEDTGRLFKLKLGDEFARGYYIPKASNRHGPSSIAKGMEKDHG